VRKAGGFKHLQSMEWYHEVPKFETGRVIRRIDTEENKVEKEQKREK